MNGKHLIAGSRALYAPEFFSEKVGTARRFYLDLNPSRRKPLVVVCGGIERCAADYEIDRSTFPYFCIEYVASGKGELRLGKREYTLKAGDVFSYRPGISHHITTDPREPLVKYFVDFVGKRAAELLGMCGRSGEHLARLFPPHSVVTLFDELIETGLNSRLGTHELCGKLLECIVLKIASASTPPEAAKSRTFAAYWRCRTFIELHFLRLKTLEQIAAECSMDEAYICRLFHSYDHQTPYQFLLRLKMSRAAVELQNPQVLVKDVAAIVGFKDSYHFSRVFRHVLGASPAEFRKLR